MRTRKHRIMMGPIAALAVTLGAATGCSNSWALGGLPGSYDSSAQANGAAVTCYGRGGFMRISGGGPELLALACGVGAVLAVALAIEGARRLFGISCP
jgi:hypothetical protein